MAKNPFMSAYLSSWNKMANTARGQMTAAVKAEQKKAGKQMMDAWFDAFTPTTGKKTTKKKSTGKRTAAKRRTAR
ncbi:MAG: hypothetical protein Q4G46_10910 [Propionibacteriaceae bacterium]|nr:hypothetical protein [Propionibacteriaceae bacterium]